MSEINDLDIVDANNTGRFPEGMLASDVNDSARELEGIIARWHEDGNASIASTGSANAYVLAAKQTLSAYYDGLIVAFDANFASTGACTLSVDAVSADTIKKHGATDLAADDIKVGQKVFVVHDGTNWQMISPLGNAPGTGNGDVVGPASATDGATATYDGTTGKLLKDGVVLGTVATLDSGTGSGAVPLVGTKSSTETLAGLVEKSTSAENVTGTDDTVWPTVAGTKEMIDTHATGGGWVFVSASTASASATIAFTGMEAGYDYQIEMYNLQSATDAVDLYAQVGITGPTYRTANYKGTTADIVAGTSGGIDYTSQIELTRSPFGTGANELGRFTFTLNDPAAVALTFFQLLGALNNSSAGEAVVMGGGHHTTSEAHTAIQFKMSSGNIATGEFKLYRRLNA